MPVPNNDAYSTAAVLSALFQKHGPPLVLKPDNGSAFIADEMHGLLESQSVLPLRNPARTPQYNGSCEAAGGSHRRMTDDQAVLDGHHDCWTSSDMLKKSGSGPIFGETASLFRTIVARKLGPDPLPRSAQ